MSSYILSVTVCAVAVAFISIAAPQRGGLNRFISYLSSLVISAVILAPITKEIDVDLFFDIPTEESEYAADYNKIAAESLSESIAKTLDMEYGIKVNKIIVVMGKGDGFVVDKVCVWVDKTMLDISKISSEVSNLYNCKIEITTGGSG